MDEDKVLQAYLEKRLYKPSEESRNARREQLIPTVYIRSDTALVDALPTSSSSYTVGNGADPNFLIRNKYPMGTWGEVIGADHNTARFRVPWQGLYTMVSNIDYFNSFSGGTGIVSVALNPVMGGTTFSRTDRYVLSGQSSYRFNLQGFNAIRCNAGDELTINLFISSTPQGAAGQSTHQIERFHWWIDFLG